MVYGCGFISSSSTVLVLFVAKLVVSFQRNARLLFPYPFAIGASLLGLGRSASPVLSANCSSVALFAVGERLRLST